MPSSTLGSTNGRTTSGVACHHSPWTANTVERCRGWHDITSLGQYKRSATLGVESHHCPWTAHTVEQRRVWHAIIAFWQHKRSNYIGRGMPSSPLGSTNGRMTSGVACHRRLWTSTNSRTASGVACHHLLWAAQTVERRWAWHDITALGLHAQSGDVGYGMTSPPLACIDGRTTSRLA